jgi:hypothetical protein
MSKPLIARLLLITALLLLSHTTVAKTMRQTLTPNDTDIVRCAQADALPKTADKEARRIACNIPSNLQEQVTQAQIIGAQIRRHDIAAWTTTDALKLSGAFKDVPGEMQGWLSVESEQSIIVRYYTKKDNAMYVFAEASMGLKSFKSDRGIRYSPLRPASATEMASLKARNLALHSKNLNCSDPFNSVILPFTENNTPILRTYLFSPWTDNKAPLGGHHLLKIKADGSEMLSQYSLTKTCINYNPNLIEKMDSFMLTHLTSDTPNEMHVFMSLQYQKPIFITTVSNGLNWKVDRAKIQLLARKDGKALNDVINPLPKTEEVKAIK